MIILKGKLKDGSDFVRRFLSGFPFQKFLEDNPDIEVSEFRDSDKAPRPGDDDIPVTR
jgi:hypothetical protein